jgi:phosphotransferase system IIB component
MTETESIQRDLEFRRCLDRAAQRLTWVPELCYRVLHRKGYKRVLATLSSVDKPTRLRVSVRNNRIIVTYRALGYKKNDCRIPLIYEHCAHKITVTLPNGRKVVKKDIKAQSVQYAKEKDNAKFAQQV